MPGEGPLLTIAEISVALAGFSAVVIALRGAGPHAWSAQDRFGLGNVLAASVGTLLGSLLPFPLAALGWSLEAVWSVSNAVVALLVLGSVGFLARASTQGNVPPRAPRAFWSFMASGVVVGVALLLAALGVVFPSGPAVLLFALIWGLLAAFGQLATFVLVTWTGEP